MGSDNLSDSDEAMAQKWSVMLNIAQFPFTLHQNNIYVYMFF